MCTAKCTFLNAEYTKGGSDSFRVTASLIRLKEHILQGAYCIIQIVSQTTAF